MFGNSIYLFIFEPVIMLFKSKLKRKTMKNTQLTNEQTRTLDCILTGEIIKNRVNLQSVPKFYTGELTHLRHIRAKIRRLEAETDPLAGMLTADDMENVALYNTFAL